MNSNPEETLCPHCLVIHVEGANIHDRIQAVIAALSLNEEVTLVLKSLQIAAPESELFLAIRTHIATRVARIVLKNPTRFGLNMHSARIANGELIIKTIFDQLPMVRNPKNPEEMMTYLPDAAGMATMADRIGVLIDINRSLIETAVLLAGDRHPYLKRIIDCVKIALADLTRAMVNQESDKGKQADYAKCNVRVTAIIWRAARFIRIESYTPQQYKAPVLDDIARVGSTSNLPKQFRLYSDIVAAVMVLRQADEVGIPIADSALLYSMDVKLLHESILALRHTPLRWKLIGPFFRSKAALELLQQGKLRGTVMYLMAAPKQFSTSFLFHLAHEAPADIICSLVPCTRGERDLRDAALYLERLPDTDRRSALEEVRICARDGKLYTGHRPKLPASPIQDLAPVIPTVMSREERKRAYVEEKALRESITNENMEDTQQIPVSTARDTVPHKQFEHAQLIVRDLTRGETDNLHVQGILAYALGDGVGRTREETNALVMQGLKKHFSTRGFGDALRWLEEHSVIVRESGAYRLARATETNEKSARELIRRVKELSPPAK